MKLSDTVPCWTCELCRRMDGVQDPDTCPYGDGWCNKYRAWASEAWSVAVGPFKVLEHVAPPKPQSRMVLELGIMQRYNKGMSDIAIEAEMGLTHGVVFRWRERNNLPANHSGRGWRAAFWHVYMAATDELLAQGTRDDIMQLLGIISAQSFRSTVSRVRRGLNKKYVILKDGQDVRGNANETTQSI